MTNVFFDAWVDDDTRRAQLYAGDIFVYSPTSAALELCQLAQDLSHAAFGKLDPAVAQHTLPVEKFNTILADLKPTFINHPAAKSTMQQILREFGCDLEKTYLDPPRLRTATSDNYLTTGLAYAFPPHRDTWYAAPQSQLNWWMPVFDIEPGNGLAFHPQYWNKPLRNGSENFDYNAWGQQGKASSQQGYQTDARVQPCPQEPIDLAHQLRLVTKVGGLVLFSGAHLHSSVPNVTGKTRFSIDFRTAHLDEILTKGGAANCDSFATGTSLVGHLRGTDLARLPADILARYDHGTPVTHPVYA